MKLSHPDSDVVVEVADEAAAGPYKSQGWLDQSEAKSLTKKEGV